MSEDSGISAQDEPHSPRPPITRKRKFAFAMLILLAFLIVLEIVGRVVVPIDGNARWNYESNHVRLTGFPALNDILESDAKRFWKLRPNVQTRQVIGRVGADNLIFSISTDGDGYRKMPAVQSPRNTILFIGDSCTLGIGVDDDATIPAVVQDRLPGVRCINAGVPGYSAYQGRVYLESIIGRLKPDIVVMCFGFNDNVAWDDRSDLEHAAAMAAPADWGSRFGVTRLIGQFAAPSGTRRPAGSRPRLTDAEFSTEIESMMATCTANEARSILLIWPLREQLDQAGLTGKQFAFARAGQIKGAAIVDLVQAARTRHENTLVDPAAPGSVPPVFADLLHFNRAGCAMAAGMIVNEINGATKLESAPAP